MSTIGSKRIVEDIIDGEYKHDDWIKIVEYTDQGNKRTWGCVAQRDDDPDRYERVTQWVRDPVVIWRKKKAMTPVKQLILDSYTSQHESCDQQSNHIPESEAGEHNGEYRHHEYLR